MTLRVTTQPWMCQLVHVDEVGDGVGVGLDLIALEECPFAGIELPVGMPFVIRILERRATQCAGLVRAWADKGAVVTLRLVDMRPGQWLCLSGGDEHVLLAMNAR